MEKTLYLYGSARNSATRALRRATLPREMQIRVGPWIVRPSRRVAVQDVELVKYEREVIEKVEKGVVQVQAGDTTPYSIAELRAGFEALRSVPGAPTPMTMSYAELMELMRSDAPSQAVWDAFVSRSLDPQEAEREALPSLDVRVRALTDAAERYSAKLNTLPSLQLIRAAADAHEAEKRAAAEADRLARAEAEAKAQALREQDQRKIVTEPAPPATADAPESVDADPEQMDFSGPKAEETPETTATESVEQPVVETPVAEAAPSARAEREAKLPEGWKAFTNAKLIELLTGLEIAVPERQNKASLTAAVEAWLEGS